MMVSDVAFILSAYRYPSLVILVIFLHENAPAVGAYAMANGVLR